MGETQKSEPLLQVLRYMPREKYDGHHDYFDPAKYDSQTDVSSAMERVVTGGRNRFATVLWYLATPDSGGETHFPRSGGLPEPPETAANCGQQEDGQQQGQEEERAVGLKVPAHRRYATLFYNLRPDGACAFFRYRR